MIDFVRGRVAQVHESRLVLEVAGIGLGIDVPASVAAKAPTTGSEMLLHTELVVREDALQLVGFASPEQRQLYRSLTSVSGIGPKVALKALGGMEPEELAGAIVRGDVASLTRLPGIGKKTAQVLVASLTDAMSKLRIAPVGKATAAIGLPPPIASRAEDARLALQALGMEEGRAREALARALSALGAQAETAQLVTEALRRN